MTDTTPRRPPSPRRKPPMALVLPPEAVPEWDDPDASGAQVLDSVLAALTSYVAFPSIEAAHAVALFIAATHAQPSWEHATRLVIKSPMRQCGKTRLLEVLVELVHRPLPTTNISPAALVRSINEKDPPTILLDESDAIFATRRGERSEGAEDLRGILNSGHARGWPYMRWDAVARKLDECPTFAMAVLAGIGDMPDTVEDRAVIITMRRRAAGEQVERFRRRRSVPPLKALKGQVRRWVNEVAEDLADAEPDLPVDDRPADVWEPLVAIADAAGGHWPARARTACERLTGQGRGDEADGARLLADIHRAFGGNDRMSTENLLARLNADDTNPWGGWHRGDGLNPRDLARLLKPYEVGPTKIRIGPDTAKGYLADDFADAWGRYVADLGNRGNRENIAGHSVAKGNGHREQEEHEPEPCSPVPHTEIVGNALTREVPNVPPVPDGRPEVAEMADEALELLAAEFDAEPVANPGTLGPVDREELF